MHPDELKALLFDYLKGKIEDLLVIDRVIDTEITEQEVYDLIINGNLTVKEITDKFQELITPYFKDYESRAI